MSCNHCSVPNRVWGREENIREGFEAFLRAARAFGGYTPTEVSVAALVEAQRVGRVAVVAEIDRAFEAAVALSEAEGGFLDPEPIEIRIRGRYVTLTYGGGRSFVRMEFRPRSSTTATWVVEAGVYAGTDDVDRSAAASAQKRADAGW